MTENLKELIKDYIDFPKKGILFKDVLPLLQHPKIFSNLVEEMSSSNILKNADAILSIDARGFIFGTAISSYLSKPMVVARKPGKLPGVLIEKSYDLEYGKNSLSIQKESIEKFSSYAIVDDLLATGGTIDCVAKLIRKNRKEISGALTVVELSELGGKSRFDFPVDTMLSI